jgi:fluoride exporter
MHPLILTMAGGALGAGARYLTGVGAARALGTGWPWSTLIVNIVGGLAIGLLAARVAADDPWRLFLGVGVLGGFTTFSAFSLETFAMIQRGAWSSAIPYAALSVVLSVGAVAIGMAVAR